MHQAGSDSAAESPLPSVHCTAVQFPEVSLLIKGHLQRIGKIIGLEGDSLMFRSSPYWSSKICKFNVNDIEILEFTEKKSAAAQGLAIGFAVTYVISGVLFLVTSEYDEDFKAALVATPILSLGGGLIGLVLGGIGDVFTKTSYPMWNMPHDRKIKTLCRVMGVQP
jgi:hypothetical protein